MGKFDEYLDRAKDLAEDAAEIAKTAAGEAWSKAKELTEEGGMVRELAQSAKEQSSAIAFGAKEKVEGALKDVKAGKEIKQAISEMEALPDFDGSILYRMEYETMVSDLKSLLLVINDNRLDDGSVVEEINEVLAKVQPAEGAAEAAETEAPQLSDEEMAIQKAKAIVFGACTRALEAISAK